MHCPRRRLRPHRARVWAAAGRRACRSAVHRPRGRARWRAGPVLASLRQRAESRRRVCLAPIAPHHVAQRLRVLPAHCATVASRDAAATMWPVTKRQPRWDHGDIGITHPVFCGVIGFEQQIALRCKEKVPARMAGTYTVVFIVHVVGMATQDADALLTQVIITAKAQQILNVKIGIRHPGSRN